MSLLKLVYDITTKNLIRDQNLSGIFELPPLQQRDQVPIDFRVVRQISWSEAPFYEAINLSGVALRISIGSAGTVDASATAWTEVNGGESLSGVLDLATASLNALTADTTRQFEVQITGAAGGPYSGRYACTIRTAVYVAANEVPVPTGTPISREEAIALFMQRNAVRSFVAYSVPNGTKQFLCYLRDDGSLAADPLN